MNKLTSTERLDSAHDRWRALHMRTATHGVARSVDCLPVFIGAAPVVPALPSVVVETALAWHRKL
jgi:hypothetical protein